MSIAYDLARLVLDFVGTIRCGDLEWQQQKVEEIAALKEKKLVLAAETQNELNKLKVLHEQALVREREKQKRITRDYSQFLDSIDDMKQKMLQTFSEMPKPVAFIVHAQARSMLDRFWHDDNERGRELARAGLANLMVMVYEDSERALVSQSKIPLKTIEFIRNPAVTGQAN